MTSRQWKDRREKEDFLRQLREFRDETVLSQDLDPSQESFSEAIERQYWQDCRDGLFDDDWDEVWYEDDWDDDDDWRSDYDPWDEPDDWADSTRFPAGSHVRVNGVVYLALDDGRCANVLTGETVRILPVGEKEVLNR